MIKADTEPGNHRGDRLPAAARHRHQAGAELRPPTSATALQLTVAMIQNVLRNLGGIGVYGVISVCLFFAFFRGW